MLNIGLSPVADSESIKKSNLLSYSLYYTEACNEFVGPILVSLRQQTSFRRNVAAAANRLGKTVTDLTGLRSDAQISASRDERIPNRPIGWCEKLQEQIHKISINLSFYVEACNAFAEFISASMPMDCRASY